MVIEYVGNRTGNPVKRLKDVLSDIRVKPQSGNQGRIRKDAIELTACMLG